MGPKYASSVLENLSNSAVEKIIKEIHRNKGGGPEEKEEILSQMSRDITSTGNIDPISRAKEFLKGGINSDLADEIVQKISHKNLSELFLKIEELSPTSLAGVLKEEHSQAVAVMLSSLSPKFQQKFYNFYQKNSSAVLLFALAVL